MLEVWLILFYCHITVDAILQSYTDLTSKQKTWLSLFSAAGQVYRSSTTSAPGLSPVMLNIHGQLRQCEQSLNTYEKTKIF